LGIIPKCWMRIQWQMCAVDSEVVLNQRFDELKTMASPWVGFGPKEPMMDQEKICFCLNGEPYGRQRCIDRGSDASYFSVIGDLESVYGAIVIGNLVKAQ